MKRTLLVALAFALTGGAARGDVSISSYLKKVPGYQLGIRQEITDLQGQNKIGAFPKDIAEEYVLKSYSRWEAVPASSAPVASPVTEIEIYETVDPPTAFGLFSIWEKLENKTLGGRLNLPIEHRQSGPELIFWRGSYFLHLRQTGNASEDRSRAKARRKENVAEQQPQPAALEGLVRSLLDAIPAADILPVAVARLPQQELQQGSVSSYLGPKGLSLAPDFPKPLVPLMGLKDHIEIARAVYSPNNTAVFVIAYPTPKLAENYSIKIQDALGSYFGQESVYLKRSGPLVALCLGSEKDAERILGRVKYTATVKWLEDKPDNSQTATFLGLVTRAILGTAAFLVATLALGVGVGCVRYLFMQRYPDVGKKEEMIRLKLDGR